MAALPRRIIKETQRLMQVSNNLWSCWCNLAEVDMYNKRSRPSEDFLNNQIYVGASARHICSAGRCERSLLPCGGGWSRGIVMQTYFFLSSLCHLVVTGPEAFSCNHTIFFVVAGLDVPYAGCPLVYTWMFFCWCLPAFFLIHRDGELGSRLLPPFAKRLLGLFEFAVLWTKWSKECLKSARPIYISQWQKWLWVLVFFAKYINIILIIMALVIVTSS